MSVYISKVQPNYNKAATPLPLLVHNQRSILCIVHQHLDTRKMECHTTKPVRQSIRSDYHKLSTASTGDRVLLTARSSCTAMFSPYPTAVGGGDPRPRSLAPNNLRARISTPSAPGSPLPPIPASSALPAEGPAARRSSHARHDFLLVPLLKVTTTAGGREREESVGGHGKVGREKWKSNHGNGECRRIKCFIFLKR